MRLTKQGGFEGDSREMGEVKEHPILLNFCQIEYRGQRSVRKDSLGVCTKERTLIYVLLDILIFSQFHTHFKHNCSHSSKQHLIGMFVN